MTESCEGEALYLRARRMMRTGQLEKAREILARAAVLEPAFPDALEAYGELLDMTGRSDLALSMFDAHRRHQFAARRAAPDRPAVLRRTGRLTAEVAAYVTASRCFAFRPFPFMALGGAYLAQGMPRKALVHYLAALACRPKNPDALALKGEALSMMGCQREAVLAFDAAIAGGPQDPDAFSGRAIALLARGETDAAAGDWRRQLELLPVERSAARACVALRLADYDLALPELERAIRKDPSDAYWPLYRATALRRLGRADAIALPAPPNAWPAPLFALHCKRSTADEVLQQAGAGQRRVEALFQLGVLAASREPAKARRYWQHVVDQSSPTMIEHAAACYELARLGP